MPSGLLAIGVMGLLGATAFAAMQPGHRSARTAAKPVMRDEFSGTKLDAHRWSRCHWWSSTGCTIASNHELEWYLPGQVSVRHGVLRLTAQRRRYPASDGKVHPYVSGMVSSGPSEDDGPPRFVFQYGRAEVRARVPAGRGLWSAF